MSVDIQTFIGRLKSKARTWSEVAEDVGACLGLRVIKFSGDIVRTSLLDGLTSDWLDRLFKQLPDDVCIMDAGHSIIFVEYVAGSYYDNYCIIVGSHEWDALKQGEPIPELRPLFNEDKPHKDTTQPTIQLPLMEEEQTHWLIGTERQMYYKVNRWGCLEPIKDGHILADSPMFEDLKRAGMLAAQEPYVSEVVNYLDAQLASDIAEVNKAGNQGLFGEELEMWTCERHQTPVPEIPRGEKCPVCENHQ